MSEPQRHCHDCNIQEGGIHFFGCDMEKCPFCGHQLIMCGCCYDMLNVSCEPGTDVYENGLDESDEDKWLEMLGRKGRIPYIRYPNMCCYCGKLWPEMFHVEDEDWMRYVAPAKRLSMLCLKCYGRIKDWIDEAQAVTTP